MSPNPSRPPRTFADKLNHLVDTVHPGGGVRPYSNAQLADVLRTRGVEVSATYLWALRTGKSDNPTRDLISALAKAFEVSPEYFFDSDRADRIYEQLELLTALTDPSGHALAIRGRGLPASSLRPILEVIRYVRDREGLSAMDEPDVDGAPGRD